MNNTQLERGNIISKEVQKLEQHLENIKRIAELKSYKKDYPITLHYFLPGGLADQVLIVPEFIQFDDFFLLYISKIEKKIESLKKEFSEL